MDVKNTKYLVSKLIIRNFRKRVDDKYKIQNAKINCSVANIGEKR